MNISTMPLAGVKALPPQEPGALDYALRVWHFANGCSFPLEAVPERSYKDAGTGFGAKRPAIGPGILHPACDLVAPVGTPVLAVDDGVVIRGPYDFYLGTDAIDVQHRFFVARYGELKKGFRLKNKVITRGQVLGELGNVGSGHMLHFEMFAGTATGYLTVNPKPPWNRRADLIDPTPFLDLWAMKM